MSNVVLILEYEAHNTELTSEYIERFIEKNIPDTCRWISYEVKPLRRVVEPRYTTASRVWWAGDIYVSVAVES